MYLSHYGLSDQPFRITPDTSMFFSGGKRGSTLDALLFAVLHGEGIVKITGEVGSGKTMLCRVLMEHLPQHVKAIYLANPSYQRDEIHHALADELGVPGGNARISNLLRALQDRLITLYAQGKQVLLLIDEAHAMPEETLEEIRLVSNLESARHKLLQITLFGQPELSTILARKHMRQLLERITYSFNLEPLNKKEVREYLDFRLRRCGYRGPDLFSRGAASEIYRYSRGITRRINILADKTLLSAFADGRHALKPADVRRAARDSEFSTSSAVRAPWRKWGVVILLLLAVGAVWYFKNLRWSNRAMTIAPTQTTAQPSSFPVAASPASQDAANVEFVGPRLPADLQPQPSKIDENSATPKSPAETVTATTPLTASDSSKH